MILTQLLVMSIVMTFAVFDDGDRLLKHETHLRGTHALTYNEYVRVQPSMSRAHLISCAHAVSFHHLQKH